MKSPRWRLPELAVTKDSGGLPRGLPMVQPILSAVAATYRRHRFVACHHASRPNLGCLLGAN
jgi:hypothetical protein